MGAFSGPGITPDPFSINWLISLSLVEWHSYGCATVAPHMNFAFVKEADLQKLVFLTQTVIRSFVKRCF